MTSVSETSPSAAAQASMMDPPGIELGELTALFVLDAVKGFGPQKFKELHVAGVHPADVVSDPGLLPTAGKRGDGLRELLRAAGEGWEAARRRAEKQVDAARRHRGWILTYSHPRYPPNLYASNNPVPILYARGAPDVLTHRKAVACVGSRKISPPYIGLHESFAQIAATDGYSVVSGFALGADTVGHRAAVEHGGRTICCMPGGLDRPFPPENRSLWEQLLSDQGAVFVSEFAFGTGASSLTLRKRNKLIVGLAQGVLVSQSSVTGGAMNAYRFALEQHKPLASFADDGSIATAGNRQVGEMPAFGTIFPSTPDPEAYRKWLRGLSS